jgi:hypothetical protein
MTLLLRKSADRGKADHGWLKSHHTFSFADYLDAEHHHFRALRVINEDRVAPGEGFPSHAHADMEILTYVLEGGVRHKDSMGTNGILRPGDVQRMTAGRGVVHSEFNASSVETLHFLQIWLFPETRALEPGYEQKRFDDKRNRLRLIASRDARDGSLAIHQDADVYASELEKGGELRLALKPGRGAWLQVARGVVSLNGIALAAGDGARIEDESALVMGAVEAAEFLLFDLR